MLLHYPRTLNGISYSRPLRTVSVVGDAQSTALPAVAHFEPVDDSQFPDNMAVIAVVEKDGNRVEDAEVAAFINGECRGAVSFHKGYYFLTIMGSSSADKDATIELRVWHDGQEFIVENEKTFVSDAAYGTLEAPYVLRLDNATTGISTVGISEGDDGEWYTLQGFKLGKRPNVPGVYIHKGKTVVIKNVP